MNTKERDVMNERAMNVTKAVEILRSPALRASIGISEVSNYTPSFYGFIADRLAGRVSDAISDSPDKKLVPMGYNLCVELALHDAQKGVDGFRDNAPLRGRFVGLPPMMYAIMSMPLFEKSVITALFDEAFADEVLAFRAEIVDA